MQTCLQEGKTRFQPTIVTRLASQVIIKVGILVPRGHHLHWNFQLDLPKMLSFFRLCGLRASSNKAVHVLRCPGLVDAELRERSTQNK